jgi:hypothetical protein
MTINQVQFAQVVEKAKAAAANSPRWLRAVERAAEGILTGSWIVTELADGILVTTESGSTYHANGVCQCKAFARGQACKRRAAARLISLYNESDKVATKGATSPAPRIARNIESERTGVRYTVVRCDGWVI